MSDTLSKEEPTYLRGLANEKKYVKILLHSGLTCATAESCTGGMLAAMLTAVPGASAVFKGGVVSYANEVKQNILGVSATTLRRHGAVSEATALAMARGARKCLNAETTVAITGIAGPGGAVAGKPVGTVYIAVATPRRSVARRYEFSGSRHAIRRAACAAALRLWVTELRFIHSPRR